MKNYSAWTIYKDCPLLINSKITCYSLKRKKHYFRFELLNGDIPVASFNGSDLVAVVNTRGIAYAARNRLCYRKTKKQRLNSINKAKWLNS